MHIQRETALGGLYKKSAYCNDGPTCGNRQMHKAEGPRSGTVATAADCACIASCVACTKVCVLCPLARLPASFLVNAKSLRTNERMESNGVRRNERVRSSLFATFWEGGCLCRRHTRERKVCAAVLERTTLKPTLLEKSRFERFRLT